MTWGIIPEVQPRSYWGVNQGTRKELGQNGLTDVAETIAETERTAETEVINISKLDKMSKLQNNRRHCRSNRRIRKDNAAIKGQNAFENNNSDN